MQNRCPFFLLLLAVFISRFALGQSPQTIQNLEAFGKVYGYVRYFHPSDEAANLDWDKFAIYGCQRVENAKNPAELKASLQELDLKKMISRLNLDTLSGNNRHLRLADVFITWNIF